MGQITARAGERTDVALTLYESGVALTDDLTSAACQWRATKYGETDISGDATGAANGAVTVILDLDDATPVGWWEFWVQVDGVTWPTERNNSSIKLKVEKDV